MSDRDVLQLRMRVADQETEIERLRQKLKEARAQTSVKTAGQETEIERLRQKLKEAQAQTSVKTAGYSPLAWGLTHAEAEVLGLLIEHPVVSRDCVLMRLYPDRPVRDWPNKRSVDSIVRRMRRKLAPRGIEIFKVYSQGYRLDDHARAALREARAA